MSAVEHPVQLERISQERYIQAPIERVYDYITQPDRWHEWHPSSLGADTGTRGSLPTGQRFTERIDLLGVQMPLGYRVQIARPPREFKAIFTSQAVDGCIHYVLLAAGGGTLLKRTFTYQTELQFCSLHERIIRISNQALDQLKHILECT